MNILRKILLNLRIAWRARTFKQMREMGMTVDEARAYADYEHPLTPAEAAYEREMGRKNEIPKPSQRRQDLPA
ncbi:hypothetical protein ABIE49_001137 [Bradyrhizobium sp. OAE829]